MPYSSVNSPENERNNNAFKGNISSSRITYGTRVIRKLIICEDYGMLSFSFSNDFFIFDFINTLLSLLLTSSCLKSKSVKQYFALHTTKRKISCSCNTRSDSTLDIESWYVSQIMRCGKFHMFSKFFEISTQAWEAQGRFKYLPHSDE